MEEYQKKYEAFQAELEVGISSAEGIGVLIVQLVQHFSEKNMALAKCDKGYNKKVAETIDSVDELTGKPMSAAKADVMAKASEEYGLLVQEKVHLQNLEQMINALKALQRGLSNEYAHVAGI